jgi:membrane protein implicated in regulation of membrane protease activity
MIELLEGLQFWQWWLFAGALVVVETLLPSGILYGVVFAAFSVGAAMAAPNIDIAST